MRSREEEIERIRKKARERYESDLVYEINGARGRSIRIYPYKCIISTSVTAGSLLTRNATIISQNKWNYNLQLRSKMLLLLGPDCFH